MIQNRLLIVTLLVASSAPIAPAAAVRNDDSTRISSIQTPPPAPAPAPKDDGEFAKRKKEAGKDTLKLWKLYEWCKEQKKDKEGKATLKEILKIDPAHTDANRAIGNLFFDGKWFENQKKIDEYKKEKELQDKKAQGLVEYKGEWVPKDDVPFLEKGLVRDDVGNWVSGEDAKKLKEGYVKQDLEWVSPAEKDNIGKGLWKCGDKWLPLAEADKFHSDFLTPWKIPCDRYNVWTTCDRDLVLSKIKRQLDPAFDDLEKIYGVKPAVPVNVFIVRTAEQYGSFSAGDEATKRDTNDMTGMSSAYYAYLADTMYDADFNLHNMGVTFWDESSKEGSQWGIQHVRHAIGQSFAEAIDPSTKALEIFKKTPKGDNNFGKKFYDEKRIPRWYRYGAASYVERYYNDSTVGIGGNPQWAKKWSVEQLLKAGGLRPLKQVLEFNLHPADPTDTARLINEAGLVMAFVVDGKCAPLMEKHKAFQEAFKAGKDKKELAEVSKAFEAEIVKNEVDLRKFAGL